ncbi:hypothetical protein [Amphibacillus jilinensis]|uniref:hypothetical protein n=1 Tax=Amphibacillus jilinensis TaxID=1216008 RepID=UPI0002E9D00F|nr:hypothetical protein [Amphibacillus jilinensis]
MTTLTTDKMLTKHQERYEEIIQCENSTIKGYRLVALMTDMERAYQIPLIGVLRIEAFKQAYPDVMELYKQVSNARWN